MGTKGRHRGTGADSSCTRQRAAWPVRAQVRDRATHLGNTVRAERAVDKSRLGINPGNDARAQRGGSAQLDRNAEHARDREATPCAQADRDSQVFDIETASRDDFSTGRARGIAARPADGPVAGAERVERLPHRAETVRTFSVLDLGGAAPDPARPAAAASVARGVAPHTSPAGETGKRSRLKIGGPGSGRVGSTPTPGIGAQLADSTLEVAQ